MFKKAGLQVYSNDFLHFSHYIAKATVENSHSRLDQDDLDCLLAQSEPIDLFVSNTFHGLYFSDEDNIVIDHIRSNIELLRSEHKRALALAALSRACLKKRARGIFTFTGDKYNDGRRDMKMSLRDHFILNVEAFNASVFDNGQDSMALNRDVFDLDIDADLVYLDPPYYTPYSDNDYTRRYHFVEGLVRRWEGLEIQYETKTRKFKRYPTPFMSRNTVYDAFDRLFDKFSEAILVVSYSSNSIPHKNELIEKLKRYKKRVRVSEVNHTYSFGTHRHRIGNHVNRVQEYLFVAF